jgi:Flp pilus assembly protein TadG
MSYRKLKNEDGAGLVEFALIAIFLFTFLFGIIETGLLVYNHQVIINAAREGARRGIVSRPDGYEIQAGDVITTVQNYTQNNIISFGNNNLVVTPQFEFDSGSTPYCTQFQEELTVNVTYDYSYLFLPYATKTLGTSVVMLCE